jgi:anti-sigma B factor antagonist
MLEDRPGNPLSAICSVQAERHLDTVILRLYGEFDLSSEQRFREELEAVLADGATTVVVDLRSLSFMDSTGLRALVSLHNHATVTQIDFAVLCDGGAVRRVLQATRLDSVLPMVDTGAVPLPEPAP